jgi:hypothetical protein
VPKSGTNLLSLLFYLLGFFFIVSGWSHIN